MTDMERIVRDVLADSSLHLQDSKKRALESRFAEAINAARYNGWTNYATWGVALVLSNDHGVYDETREQAAAFKSSAPDQPQVTDGTWTAEQAARFGLEDWLKDYTEQLCGLERDDDALSRISPSMMAHQVIAAGLAEVDWSEIAANILSELDD